MVPLSMTLSDLWPIFQGYKIFDIEHLRNNTTLNYSYYRTSIGSLMHSMEWWHFQWPWRTPNRFSRSRCFWSRISQKRCVLWSKLLKLLIESHTQSIEWYHFQWPWVTFDLDLFDDLDWPLNASRGFLSIIYFWEIRGFRNGETFCKMWIKWNWVFWTHTGNGLWSTDIWCWQVPYSSSETVDLRDTTDGWEVT